MEEKNQEGSAKQPDITPRPLQRLVMACPFCGSENPDIVHVTGSTTGWVVWCYFCGGQGPAIQGDVLAARQKAIEMWNRRFDVNKCNDCQVQDNGSGCEMMNCPDYKDGQCQDDSPRCRFNTPVFAAFKKV